MLLPVITRIRESLLVSGRRLTLPNQQSQNGEKNWPGWGAQTGGHPGIRDGQGENRGYIIGQLLTGSHSGVPNGDSRAV